MNTLKVFECKICGLKTKKISFHVKEVHKIEPKKAFVDFFLNGKFPQCGCGCKKEVKFYGFKHGFKKYRAGHQPCWLKGQTKHDPRVENLIKTASATLKKRYQTGELISSNKGKKLSSIQKEKISKTLIQGHESEKIVSWRKGKNNSNNEQFKEISKKISNTLKTKHKMGELSAWHKGLSSDDDKMKNWCTAHSKKLQEKYDNGTFKSWMANQTQETLEKIALKAKKLRLPLEEIVNRINDLKWCNLETNLSERPGLFCEITVSCKICGTQFCDEIGKLLCVNRCKRCNPNVSEGHFQISSFIESLGFTVKNNDRSIISPLEIDIAVHDKQFGIEFNGLFYHNDLDPGYHDRKSKAATQKNWKIFHVFEDEWNEKNDIVRSMIKDRLGIYDKKIGARKTIFIKITKTERKKFFNENHIDGDVNACEAYGLVFNDELVAACSIRNPLHKSLKENLEIARFATKLNTKVLGGFSKLIKNIKFNKPLISYLDTRFGGIGLQYLNFSLIKESSPRFWWTDNHHRFNRFYCRAKNNVSQSEMAKIMNLKKIYGCSNKLFRLNVD